MYDIYGVVPLFRVLIKRQRNNVYCNYLRCDVDSCYLFILYSCVKIVMQKSMTNVLWKQNSSFSRICESKIYRETVRWLESNTKIDCSKMSWNYGTNTRSQFKINNKEYNILDWSKHLSQILVSLKSRWGWFEAIKFQIWRIIRRGFIRRRSLKVINSSR